MNLFDGMEWFGVRNFKFIIINPLILFSPFETFPELYKIYCIWVLNHQILRSKITTSQMQPKITWCLQSLQATISRLTLFAREDLTFLVWILIPVGKIQVPLPHTLKNKKDHSRNHIKLLQYYVEILLCKDI